MQVKLFKTNLKEKEKITNENKISGTYFLKYVTLLVRSSCTLFMLNTYQYCCTIRFRTTSCCHYFTLNNAFIKLVVE